MNRPTETRLAYENLDVFRASLDFVCLSRPFIERLPGQRRTLADQLDRASTSILLNLAEGIGRTGGRDKKRFFAIARGSATECAALLDILEAFKLVSDQERDEAKALLVRIVQMLTRMCR